MWVAYIIATMGSITISGCLILGDASVGAGEEESFHKQAVTPLKPRVVQSLALVWETWEVTWNLTLPVLLVNILLLFNAKLSSPQHSGCGVFALTH